MDERSVFPVPLRSTVTCNGSVGRMADIVYKNRFAFLRNPKTYTGTTTKRESTIPIERLETVFVLEYQYRL